MTITHTTLGKAAGLAAVAAGALFIAVQINHPPMEVASVSTTEWVVRNSMKVVMAVLALAGITGMYLRQVRQAGLLGCQQHAANQREFRPRLRVHDRQTHGGCHHRHERPSHVHLPLSDEAAGRTLSHRVGATI